MFFGGRLPRPPWETRSRVDALATRFDRRPPSNYGDRFRFTTLQSRFRALIDLWDRGFKAREEGRSGPFAQPRSIVEQPPQRPQDRVLGVITLSDPAREVDKVQTLFEEVVSARREAGQEAIPYGRFADLVKTQVGAFKAKGCEEVAFRVALKSGKVALTARAAEAVHPAPRGGAGQVVSRF
jgi:hypothetical protein